MSRITREIAPPHLLAAQHAATEPIAAWQSLTAIPLLGRQQRDPGYIHVQVRPQFKHVALAVVVERGVGGEIERGRGQLGGKNTRRVGEIVVAIDQYPRGLVRQHEFSRSALTSKSMTGAAFQAKMAGTWLWCWRLSGEFDSHANRPRGGWPMQRPARPARLVALRRGNMTCPDCRLCFRICKTNPPKQLRRRCEFGFEPVLQHQLFVVERFA